MKLQAVLSALLLVAFSCNTAEPPNPPPPPPPYERSINLVVEDVGVTDASLRIRFLDTADVRVFDLLRNDQRILRASIESPDTLIIDTTLAPNQSYGYQAYRLLDTVRVDSTTDTTVTTMDTTGHNFVFQTFYFGGAASSELYDVAIISENNVWAVGEIYESTSPDPYSAAHFDGAQWTLHRFYYRTTGGDSLLIAPVRGVFAFGDSDVWLAAGSVFRWRGDSITPYLLRGSILFGYETVEKLWGTSATRMYGVGNAGTIVYYDGILWRKIPSGTTTDVQDIFGDSTVAIAAVSNVFDPGDQRLLQVHENNSIDTIKWSTGRRAASIWFDRISRLFVSGGGVFRRGLDTVWREQTSLPPFFTERVRGTSFNDVFVVGHFGLQAHFNGRTWKAFGSSNTHVSCQFKDNFMVAVGLQSNRAFVTMARRQ